MTQERLKEELVMRRTELDKIDMLELQAAEEAYARRLEAEARWLEAEEKLRRSEAEVEKYEEETLRRLEADAKKYEEVTSRRLEAEARKYEEVEAKLRLREQQLSKSQVSMLFCGVFVAYQ